MTDPLQVAIEYSYGAVCDYIYAECESRHPGQDNKDLAHELIRRSTPLKCIKALDIANQALAKIELQTEPNTKANNSAKRACAEMRALFEELAASLARTKPHD